MRNAWASAMVCLLLLAACGAGSDASSGFDASMAETTQTDPEPLVEAPDATADVAVATRPTCAGVEREPNNAWVRASAMSLDSMCGALPSVTDEDWYSVVYGPGSVTVALDAKGDAVFAAGVATGTSCAASLTGLHALTVTSTSTQQLCVRVTSPARRAQSYVLSRR